MWPDFIFGPINLLNVWPSPEMIALDGDMKMQEVTQTGFNYWDESFEVERNDKEG